MTMLDRRTLLHGAAGAMAAAALPARAFAADAKPNFILIYTDDLGYGDVGILGGKVIKTPNIDKMARGGMLLTDYYAPANICTPSRAAVLTGRYAIRARLGKGSIGPEDKRGLPLDDVTIPEALKPGYATALIGKWHLGNPGTPYWPPMKHGFDLFYGIPFSHDMSPIQLWSGDSKGIGSAGVDYPTLQQHFCARAEQFLDDNRDRPFFLEFAPSAPHLPNYPYAPFAGRSDGGSYGDVVEELDSIIGRILARVEKLGLERRTLVILTSDNGPWFEGSSGKLRERKGGAGFDGGYRVPFIASQPGFIPDGRRTDSIAMGIDLLPTILTMAGVPLPRGVALDGLDIAPMLTRGSASPHDQLLLFDKDDIVAIRTQRWKYVAYAHFGDGLVPAAERGYPLLFDVKADDSENYSVAARHPDVVKDMEARLDRAAREFEHLRLVKSQINRPKRPEHVPDMWKD